MRGRREATWRSTTPPSGGNLGQSPKLVVSAAGAPPTTATDEAIAAAEALWTRFWEEADRFDESRSRYILVSGLAGSNPDLGSLGNLPWSAIIDLNPLSDEEGLFHHAVPVLKRLARSLHIFGKETQSAEFHRGTAWMMAAGWESRNEPTPGDFQAWLETYFTPIRELFEAIRREVAPMPVKLVVVPGDTADQEQLNQVLFLAAATFKADIRVFLLGGNDQSVATSRQPVCLSCRTTSSRASAACTAPPRRSPSRHSLGPKLNRSSSPSSDSVGFRKTSTCSTRGWSTSRAAGPARTTSSGAAASPLGSTSTRFSTHPEQSITISSIVFVKSSLRVAISHSPSTTTQVQEGPRSPIVQLGLSADYPTAVLLRYSPGTLERLDHLFHVAQSPVLLIADASVISAPDREKLYHGLVDRNARVVILYVVRTTQNDLSSQPPVLESIGETKDDANRNRSRLVVADPLDDTEALQFFAIYSKRARNPSRVAKLRQITFAIDDEESATVSPSSTGSTPTRNSSPASIATLKPMSQGSSTRFGR